MKGDSSTSTMPRVVAGGPRRRRVLLGGAGLGLQAVLFPATSGMTPASEGPLGTPAGMTSRATHGVLTRVVRAGNRLVAMGERGLVVLSDDGGRRWRQARVPVSVTLTAATFADARKGWMVGHGAVVLHTDDGGESWTVQTDGLALANAILAAAQAMAPDDSGRDRALQQAKRLVEEGADKPFLSVCFADEQRGLVVGAFGMAAATVDGGRHWTPCMDRLPNPGGLHLYAIARQGATWVVAGEQGILMRSTDDARSFLPVVSPHRRSLFSAVALRRGGFLMAGLLGSACRLEPDASAAAPITLPFPATTLSCAELQDGRVLLLTQGAGLLVSSDGGDTFAQQQLPQGGLLTSLAEAPGGGLVATGLNGVVRLG